MSTKNKKLDYDSAYAELKVILHRLQQEDIGIEKLSVDIKRANELTAFCKERLRALENDLALAIEN